jgi:2-polyprenyl-3-methyl-5-hydroxy-6-metoxy-1,4-benzoquinol methylase
VRKGRERQLAYSDQQPLMLDEASRRAKAAKIVTVLGHFLGRESLEGLRVLDIGCSGGIIASELARSGGSVVGVDIDEPGMAKAASRFGDHVMFVLSDGERLPLASGVMDIIVLNHIYEHVLDPTTLVAELRRVLAPRGVAYLGLGNRLGVMEPHYRLPFLSWLPRSLAHAYVRVTKRADHYHERFLTRPGLKMLFAGLWLWDYTYTVIAEPERFRATDLVPPALGAGIARLPGPARAAAMTIMPTFIWLGTLEPVRPAGGPTRLPPEKVRV